MTTVGLTGYGRYLPESVLTGAEIAEASGIPESVVVEKMGLSAKRVCRPGEDHVSDMSVAAAESALTDAGVDASELDMVLYHGSEFKDHVVWSAAADICERIGADEAFATESYTLCAGAPIAIRQARAQLQVDHVDRVLLVAASREESLVDYENERSSFMFNFGSGASAMVLESDPGERARALVHESAALTDGSFSRDVIMPAGGSVEPASHESVDASRHTLDVPDPDGMKERLAPVSLPNYLTVADTALDRSGFGREDLDFVAVTHMKRSFHETLFDELGLDSATDGHYLDEYGHVQSVDQILALEEGRRAGLLESGDLVCFLAAGTGYTWAATMLTWLG
ncbi:3-oxoacyl-(acyl-carrier-protein) synthase III [Halovivax ruber XH-70]|uniref:3-oxoacyl-(Acyl-carrier-protein) synthase III n=1 Tax=Halovivax ruber (strain DSM 18193 / JCM 13892 / XH-70) TaxID=797302 RepID=L0IAM4_HALRX|nr:3-oxoacyl-ACP synthase [Halovivax ruber]AGB16650.1 3-oxoacyl-(acyl-carrier-protein) synthase III [Halovivax ruber XH-70]